MRRVGVGLAAALAAGVAVSGVAGAAEPTFVNGLAQNVFSANTADWIRGEGWVQSTSDADHDGKLDRIHFDITRPKETASGLKVPTIMEASPYYANLGPNSNWSVDVELGAQPPARAFQPDFATKNTSPKIATTFEAQWLPRGFAVVHAESPGTGYSDGCPTDGAPNENDAMKAVVDWLNGRAPAFTTRTGTTPMVADWATGKVGMMGTSYNGSLPIAAAATGVAGLEAIVPISPVSDYYEYYRANGMVRGPGGWQGEDADVLVDVVYTRQDETYPRMKCRPLIEQIGRDEDRVTGDRNAFWDERNLNALVPNMHAAVLLAHGNNDNNVMTKNATAFYEAVKKQGLPHQFFFHQGGPRRRAAGRDGQPLVHALPLRRRERRGGPAALVGRALGDRRLPAAAVDRDRGRDQQHDDHRGRRERVPARLHADRGNDHARDHQHRRQHADAGKRGARWPRARPSAWCAATPTRRRTPSGRTRPPSRSRRS